jgi:NADPH:quinone reductase-like Zn-dependent oxidoreductase
MRAVQFTGHGDRDVITYGSVPDLEPGPEEVLVDVEAGALNHVDVWSGVDYLRRIYWNQLSVIGSTMATPGELLEDRHGFGKVVVVPDSEYSP